MANHDKKYARGSIAGHTRLMNGSTGHRKESGHGKSQDAGQRSTQGTSWDAYRGWLSKMDRTASRRRGSRSIYTWKGYKSWAAKIRANWDADNADNK